MNPLDDQLDRLFRAAARMPAFVPVMPYGLETRVLAAWRQSEPMNFWNPALLRRGLIIACALMALSFWPLLKSSSSPESEYLQLADSTLQAGTTP